MARKLKEIAKIIRSKNAGPFMLTIDIIFEDERCFKEAAKRIEKSGIARLYKLDPESIKVLVYEPAKAIKINIPRAIPSGHPGDTDVYGAQQHAPLLDYEVDVNC